MGLLCAVILEMTRRRCPGWGQTLALPDPFPPGVVGAVCGWPPRARLGQPGDGRLLPPQLLNSLSVDPDAGCRFGQYFRDGRRKVDYILVYHHKRPAGARGLARRAPASDTALGARCGKQDHPLPGKGAPVDAAPEHPVDYQEDDKRFRRDEYEGHLLEAGLELERDEDVRTLLDGARAGLSWPWARAR